MRSFKALIILLLSLLCHSEVFSEAVVFSDAEKIEKIGKYVFILNDTFNKLTIDEVLKSDAFYPSVSEVPNLGVTASTFWVKFTIQNATDNSLLLQLAQPTLSVVEFYCDSGDGHPVLQHKLGLEVLFNNRKYKHQDYLFDLNLDKNKTRTFYLKVRGDDPVMLPLYVGVSKSVLEASMTKDLLFGIFFGLMMVMFLYNLFVYFTVRDSSYIYYVVYILLVCFLQATLQGYSFRYLWPGNLWLAKSTIFLLPSLAGLAAMVFARVFLQAAVLIPKLNKVLSVLIGIFCVAIIFLFLGNYRASFGIMQLNTMIGSLFVLYMSYAASKKGNRSAKFFLIAWSVLLIGAVMFVLKDFGILPYNILTTSILQIGTATEAVLLSFALADKINIFRKEKEESQAQALLALQENERIVREQNVILEAKVAERTYELELSNDGLNKAMTELKEAESQLVESEKMASLGQLTAGIAHEINNPINFVTSNVKPLNRDVRILLDAIDEMERMALDGGTVAEKQQKIASYKEEMDFEYLKEEIDQLLSGIGEGASRTAEIVKGLRIFSRLDEDDLKKADINEGLESTLIITNNMLGPYVKVKKDYANLPMIECYPGKLNQVFLNILSNAIYAVKKKFVDKDGGLLTIKTYYDDQYVMVSLADNGTGMEESTKKRLFEPFFTTKDVGEGTGLGMSIAFNTINKHNGQIIVNSEVGVGTEFIIKLPLTQN